MKTLLQRIGTLTFTASVHIKNSMRGAQGHEIGEKPHQKSNFIFFSKMRSRKKPNLSQPRSLLTAVRFHLNNLGHKAGSYDSLRKLLGLGHAVLIPAGPTGHRSNSSGRAKVPENEPYSCVTSNYTSVKQRPAGQHSPDSIKTHLIHYRGALTCVTDSPPAER